MNNLNFTRYLGALLLVGSLAACDASAPGPTAAETDGRVRLSVNNSYAEFAGHVVHINAMTTADLSPDVAMAYGLERSGGNGLVNLVVLQKTTGAGTNTPVKARVELVAANLTGQVKPVELTEIVDDTSIYYIGLVSVDDQETINFDFDIVPEGSSQNLPVRFSYRFYSR